MLQISTVHDYSALKDYFLAYSKTKTAKIYLFQANSDSTVAQSETELCRVIKIAIAIEGEISSLLRRSELIKGASPRFQARKDIYTGRHRVFVFFLRESTEF